MERIGEIARKPVTATFAILAVVALTVVDVRTFNSASKVETVETASLHPSIASDFSLPSIQGAQWELSKKTALAPRRVTLAFFCGCSLCAAAAAQVGRMQDQGELSSMDYVIALPKLDAARFAAKHHLHGTVLYDPSDSVAQKYNATECPQFWVVGKDRHVSYQSPPDLTGEALDLALNHLRAIGSVGK